MKLNKLQKKIKAHIASHRLCAGLGNEESACTIAAINLAISGKLTDARPDCVCPVIHRWVMPIQDAIPDNIRNNGWSELVPLIAGSFDPALEQKRRTIILDWMWQAAMPQLTPIADKYGFGTEWSAMLQQKTPAAARAAYAAAAAAAYAAYAAAAAAAAGYADAAARYAADADADAAADAAAAAAYARDARARDARAYWETVNPVKLLRKLLFIK